MNTGDQRIKQLISDLETRRLAVEIYDKAKVNTGPGSGFVLGGASTHLPVYCAYIAATNLNSTEFTLDTAKAVTCESKAEFDKHVRTVRGALEKANAGSPKKNVKIAGDRSVPSTPSRRGTRSGAISRYDPLFTKYWTGRPHAEELRRCMNDAEANTAMSGLFDSQTSELKLAMFYWVIMITHPGQHGLSIKELAKSEGLDLNDVQETLSTLQKNSNMAIKTKGAFARAIGLEGASDISSVPNTPSRRPVRTAPTGQTPGKTPMSPSKQKAISPSKVPAFSPAKFGSPSTPKPKAPTGDKRKLPEPPAPDEDDPFVDKPDTPSPAKASRMQVSVEVPSRKVPVFGVASIPGTPTRNHKLPPSPSKLQNVLFAEEKSREELFPSHTKPQESPRRRKRTIVEQDISEDEEERQPRRRFRPVFLDSKQWGRRDPRIVAARLRAKHSRIEP
ncbi:hypothetical protein CYLTODRAFT_484826 [Cylindrobasidium torrendii FP15055 ss-10]|uniref:Uncharacterized protein n=1 Tax=Cylindrobasidium torrendii FP15055 ss-10 TaxID=1314674 RepID=A0A0D7BUY7_9AGAR|nr:hypothetical protein CYLTODRAFT_484826 [Cylindrobasidium torrendii FP15055 ss-10]